MASPTPAHARLWYQGRFQVKIALALGLAAFADFLFFNLWPGSVLGLFALAWTMATVVAHPALWRDRRARILIALAVLMAGALAVNASPLAWTLFWSALAMAVLVPRSQLFGDAWQWLRRLLAHAITSIMGLLIDWVRIQRLKGRGSRFNLVRHLPTLILPLAGGLIFLLLFSIANPLINEILSRVDLPRFDQNTGLRMLFWGLVLVTVWGSLRPRRLRIRIAALQQGQYLPMPGVTLASVTLSLIVFNALFALQNGLDLAVMAGGVALPKGMNYADYAHQGAYPLIATALLAGGFVLLTTRQGSPMAKSQLVRSLVIGWTAQNLVLVAFSIIRTLNYVEAYSLTVMRIAALLWMGLVGVGLILITVRLLAGKSSAWLVNANVLTALALLGGCSLVDLGEWAARYNVANARQVGGKGVELDLCYAQRLGTSALVPLARLEPRLAGQPGLQAQVSLLRRTIETRVQAQQDDWHRWQWHDAVRLSRLPTGRDLRPAQADMCDTAEPVVTQTTTPIDAED
ncbi:MAG: hypothetical protein RL367_2258, partial [Pseudomonadota bacterium]